MRDFKLLPCNCIYLLKTWQRKRRWIIFSALTFSVLQNTAWPLLIQTLMLPNCNPIRSKFFKLPKYCYCWFILSLYSVAPFDLHAAFVNVDQSGFLFVWNEESSPKLVSLIPPPKNILAFLAQFFHLRPLRIIVSPRVQGLFRVWVCPSAQP